MRQERVFLPTLISYPDRRFGAILAAKSSPRHRPELDAAKLHLRKSIIIFQTFAIEVVPFESRSPDAATKWERKEKN